MGRHIGEKNVKRDLVGYKGLVVAIIKQAISDYRSLYNSVLKGKIKEDSYEFVKLRKFFLSEWYECLFDYDGKDLMNAIEIQCKNKLKKRRKKQNL